MNDVTVLISLYDLSYALMCILLGFSWRNGKNKVEMKLAIRVDVQDLTPPALLLYFQDFDFSSRLTKLTHIA